MKNKKYMLGILLLLVVGISIGYAAITTTLNINGNTVIEKSSWDIHFENLVLSEGVVEASTPATIDSTKTVINYAISLMEPGEFYEFTVDIVNAGSIDAMISEVLKEGISTEQEKYIQYSATYEDGVELEEKDLLKSGASENIRVRVKYKEDISSDDLPTDVTVLELKFAVTYVQADDSAKEKGNYLCKRASTLHTEKCTYNQYTSLYCYGSGYYDGGSKGTSTITYGNETTTNDVLKSGDAFDCDVNGDGKYDSTTERFYYVSDLYDTTNKSFDSKNAVLIYYNNTIKGVANNSTSGFISYHNTYNWYGPTVAVTNLPTSTQWSNVNLVYDVRHIANEQGDNFTGNGAYATDKFSYAGYSARLLTSQELEDACEVKIGTYEIDELDKCIYMFENTDFATGTGAVYWLETPQAANTGGGWYVSSHSRFVHSFTLNNNGIAAVRPVIEVPKSNISY